MGRRKKLDIFANITDSATIGFLEIFWLYMIFYVKSIIWVRDIQMALFEVKTAWDGKVLATLRDSIYQCLGKLYRTSYDFGWNTGLYHLTYHLVAEMLCIKII